MNVRQQPVWPPTGQLKLVDQPRASRNRRGVVSPGAVNSGVPAPRDAIPNEQISQKVRWGGCVSTDGESMILTDFGDLIAERMRAEHRVLATRWFERLLDLLPVDA